MKQFDANHILESIKKPKLVFDVNPCKKNQGVSLHSHFGGKPFTLLKGEHPPLCHNCQKTMTFVFQLNIPYADDQTNLYVMYYCFACRSVSGDKGFAVHHYHNPKLEKSNPDVPVSPIHYGEFEFELHWSLPDWESLLILYPRITDYFYRIDEEEAETKYDEAKDEFLNMWNYDTFSFYGGYPNFLNEPVFPWCDCCEKAMKPFIQIDSYTDLKLDWGNYGVLHLFQCANGKGNFKIVIQ